MSDTVEVERAGALEQSPARPAAQKCACGCGNPLPPGCRGNRIYIGDHRKKRYRRDLHERLSAAGKPTSLSLKVADDTDVPPIVPGTGARPKKPRKREPRPGVQTYFPPGSAEKVLAALQDVPELAEERELLSAAITRRDRRLAGGSPRP